MRKYSHALITAFLILSGAGEAFAQEPGRYVRLEGQLVVPLPDLAKRFAPHVAGAVGYGWALDERRSVEVRLQFARFRKGTLDISPDTTGGRVVSPDSIDVSLDLTGGSVLYRQRIGEFGPLRPHFILGGGAYHWVDRRSAYPTAGVDQPLRRAQWSGALHAGLGADVPVGGRLRVGVQGVYTLIPGELWETGRLGLSNVRTFQYVTGGLSLQVRL